MLLFKKIGYQMFRDRKESLNFVLNKRWAEPVEVNLWRMIIWFTIDILIFRDFFENSNEFRQILSEKFKLELKAHSIN